MIRIAEMLPDIAGTCSARVYHLRVLVSSLQVQRFLWMARVKQLAMLLLQLSKEWGVESLIKAMCFDTTASNTGWWSGGAVW